MGLGRATDLLVQDIVSSREMSEKIQRAVAADRRIREVRYGTFAADGVIDQAALPSGTGANLLPAKVAEYEAYTEGTLVPTTAAANGTVVSLTSSHRLLLDASVTEQAIQRTVIGPNAPDEEQVYGPDGLSYIFSSYVYQYTAAQSNYVGLKVTASELNGVNPEVIFENTASPDAMTLVDGAVGNFVRIYGQFTVPTGKPYLKIQWKILSNPGSNVAVGNNMLEVVNDYRSVPSKYVAPTPRSGELGSGQMAFGQNANLLPYQKAVLAESGSTGQDIVINSVTQGRIESSVLGTGYYFRTKADSVTFFSPYTGLLANNATRWKQGKLHFLSCDVTNMLSATDLDVRLRAREATTWNGQPSGTIMTGAATFRINRGETKRISIPITPGTDGLGGASYGPKLEVRGTPVAGGAVSGTFNDFFVSNIKLEEAEDNQTEASGFTLPSIGEFDVTYNQIEKVSAASMRRINTSVTVGASASVAVNMDTTVYTYGMDSVGNGVTVGKTGVYLVMGMILVFLGTTNVKKLKMHVRVNGGTDYQLGALATPPMTSASGDDYIFSGQLLMNLDKGDALILRATNATSNSDTVFDARLQVMYQGRV